MEKRFWGVRVLALVLCIAMLLPSVPVSAAAKVKGKAVSLDKYKLNEKQYLVLAYVANKSLRVYVRKRADVKSSAMYKLQYGDTMVVNPNRIKLGQKTKWIPVYINSKKNTGNKKYGKWATGYVQASSVKVKVYSMAKLDSTAYKYGAKAIRYGLRYLGIRHENNGNEITKAICCSGFVIKCYRSAGLQPLPLAFMDTMYRYAKKISKSKIRPGDIIFYRDGGSVSHVAIYMGDGFMLSASGHYGQNYPNGGVCIKRVNYGSRTISRAVVGRIVKK